LVLGYGGIQLWHRGSAPHLAIGVEGAKIRAIAAAPSAPPTPAIVVAPGPIQAESQPAAPAPGPVEIRLKTGAALAVRFTQRGGRVEVTPLLRPAAKVRRIVRVAVPPRLVIELAGASPRSPTRVAAPAPATALRVSAMRGGTRLVLDLDSATSARDLRVIGTKRARADRKRRR
jgi:hypothetical protein